MNEVYVGVYDRLVAQLVAPTVNVYDHVPQDLPDSSYPYVRIDPLSSNESDTDGETGFTATVQIIGFSRYRGTKEVADLSTKIYNALHRWTFPDTVSFGITGIIQEFSTIVLEKDGLTRQSIQRFKIIFEPLP